MGLASLDKHLLAWALSVVQEEIEFTESIRSNEVNQVFRLSLAEKTLFLKTGPNLEREYERLLWLEGRLPCPQPLGFMTNGETEALLMSAIAGEDLADLKATLPPAVIVTRLVTALKTLHATSIDDWPFERVDGGSVLVHGDACLPNFMYQDDVLTGYIDLGDLAVDVPETDLAAAVWSLQYNLGPGYGLPFLQEYGLTDLTEDQVERLRLMYEQDGFD